MHESLLGRIARYGVSGLRDPREDRLTEICAALFAAGECEDLARHVACGWLAAAASDGRCADRERFSALRDLLGDEGRAWSCSVYTQVRFWTSEGSRRPDLELRFTSGPPHRDVLLWVEVKHGTEPHTQQLAAYAGEQRRRGQGDAAVLLVAPRADYRNFATDEIPPGVPRLTWEQTTQSLRSYEAPGRVGEFLVADLLAYLEEEGLVDPIRLTHDHVAALVHHRAARDALDRICEIAAGEVEQLWDGPGEPGTWPERNPREYWWEYPSAPRGGQPVTKDDSLGWNWWLLLDSTDVFKDGRPGVPCFGAGITGETGSVAKLARSVRDALKEDGFLVLGPGDSNSSQWDYMVRAAYPDKDAGGVLAGKDLDSQARALAAWIDRAFRDVYRGLGLR